MTNHGHKAIFFLLKHSSDIEIENDKCIFMLIMAMWITLDSKTMLNSTKVKGVFFSSV